MPPPPDMPPPPATVAPGPGLDPYVPPKQQAPAKMDGDEEEPPADGDVKEADFVTRLIAGIIDGFVAGVIQTILMKVSWPLGWLGFAGYWLVRDALPFLDGQSLGKKLMKIRAVEVSGKNLTNNWSASITRNILLAIPIVGLIEIYMLYTKKSENKPLRRLGDEWAKTKVIMVKEPVAGA